MHVKLERKVKNRRCLNKTEFYFSYAYHGAEGGTFIGHQ